MSDKKCEKRIERIFCKFGAMVVKEDYSLKHPCFGLDMKYHWNKGCLRCSHFEHLDVNGDLKEHQKERILDFNGAKSIPPELAGSVDY